MLLINIWNDCHCLYQLVLVAYHFYHLQINRERNIEMFLGRRERKGGDGGRERGGDRERGANGGRDRGRTGDSHSVPWAVAPHIFPSY